MFRTIRRVFGSGRRSLVLAGAVPAVAAMALLAAPSASASASLSPAAPAGVAQPAQVKPAAVHPNSYSSCPASYLCFWVDAGFSGAMGKLSGSNTNWTVFSQSTCQTRNWNDCASALYNNGNSDQALVWEDAGYTGGYACVARGTTMYSNLANWTYADNSHSMNDSISSNDWTTNACT